MEIAVALFILGFVLLGIEIVAPGFGVFGFCGIGAVLIGGLIMAYRYGLFAVVVVLFIATAILIWLIRFLKRNRGAGGIILRDTLSAPAYDTKNVLHFMGKEGVTLTPLKPRGKADIDGQWIEVSSAGEYIAKNKKIKVVQINGREIIVKEIKD